jgi:hypothetical protein
MVCQVWKRACLLLSSKLVSWPNSKSSAICSSRRLFFLRSEVLMSGQLSAESARAGGFQAQPIPRLSHWFEAGHRMC